MLLIKVHRRIELKATDRLLLCFAAGFLINRRCFGLGSEHQRRKRLKGVFSMQMEFSEISSIQSSPFFSSASSSAAFLPHPFFLNCVPRPWQMWIICLCELPITCIASHTYHSKCRGASTWPPLLFSSLLFFHTPSYSLHPDFFTSPYPFPLPPPLSNLIPHVILGYTGLFSLHTTHLNIPPVIASVFGLFYNPLF